MIGHDCSLGRTAQLMLDHGCMAEWSHVLTTVWCLKVNTVQGKSCLLQSAVAVCAVEQIRRSVHRESVRL